MSTSKHDASAEYHGSPADRGGADCYYGRRRDPHYYPNGTYNGDRVEAKDMTQGQIDAYNREYDSGDFGAKHK
jgi:hypothetical protein